MNSSYLYLQLLELGGICYNTACDKQLDYTKMSDSPWVEMATYLLEDDTGIQEYSELITEYISSIFAYQMTYFDYPPHTQPTLKTKMSLPPKECYAFIKVMAAIYDKIENKALHPTIYKALEEWLEDNRPIIKSAGKR